MATRRKRGQESEEDKARDFYTRKVDQDGFEIRVLPVKGMPGNKSSVLRRQCSNVSSEGPSSEFCVSL